MKISKTALSTIITEHFTIEQIAVRSGLSVACIKEVTSGKCNPTLKTLEAIANAIDIRVDLMLGQALRADTNAEPDRSLVRRCLATIKKFEEKYGKISLPENQSDLFKNLERDNDGSKGITAKQYGYLCSIVHRLPSMKKAKAATA